MRDLTICLLLAVVVLTTFGSVTGHEFVLYDDPLYVTANARVQAGLTWKGVAWAFTSTQAYNWHPLTWVSHMLDCELFGLDAGMHHLTNVLLHAASSMLLYWFLRRTTAAVWRSAMVAALFALHPLRAESVAWLAERKDVLAVLFWMLTLVSYASYATRPSATRYLRTAVLFALGLMAKPMVVTLPFVLLLVDVWPLGRWRSTVTDGDSQGEPASRLVVEKLPLLALSILASVVTFLVQRGSGAVDAMGERSIPVRAANAAVSYVGYLAKTIWPTNLACLYPHPGQPPVWQVVGAALLLILVSVWALRSVRRRPYLTVGWLWYLGTLVPVIGLVQVGVQGMADRYTYLPHVGLLIALVWGLADLIERRLRMSPTLVAAAALSILAVLSVATWRQVRTWRDSFTLFEHALAVTRDNFVMHNNLANALILAGRHEEGISHCRRALEIRPDYADAHGTWALGLIGQDRMEDAIGHFTAILELEPERASTHVDLGLALYATGRVAQALESFREALRLEPDNARAQAALNAALER